MSSLRSKYRANLGCGIFFLVLAIATSLYARTIPISALNFGGFNAQTFPLIISAVMAILSLILIVQSVFGLKKAPQPTAEELKAEKADRKRVLNAACAVTLVALYIGFLKSVGYLIMSPLFLFGLFMLVTPKSVRRPVRSAVTAVVVSIIIFLIFRYAFSVQLPLGILKNIL